MNPDAPSDLLNEVRVPCPEAVFLAAEERLLGPESEAVWRELLERQALLERQVSEVGGPDVAAFTRALHAASGALAKIRDRAESRRAKLALPVNQGIHEP
jgi:hypothetical protein